MYPLQKQLVIQTAFLVTLLAGASFPIGSKAIVHDEEHFFETKVRPLLVAKCYECHSEEISEAGLRLDSYQSVLKGSDAGIPKQYTPCRYHFKAGWGCRDSHCEFSHSNLFHDEQFTAFFTRNNWVKNRVEVNGYRRLHTLEAKEAAPQRKRPRIDYS